MFEIVCLKIKRSIRRIAITKQALVTAYYTLIYFKKNNYLNKRFHTNVTLLT